MSSDMVDMLGFVRTRSAELDYGFLGAEPDPPWWWEDGDYRDYLYVNDYVSGAIVTADDRGWGAYLGGIPSCRRDNASGTTIRYDLVLATGAGSRHLTQRDGHLVGDLVASWIAAAAAQDPRTPGSVLSRGLDAQFADPAEVASLLTSRSRDAGRVVSERVGRLVGPELSGRQTGQVGAPETVIPFPGSSWVGGLRDPDSVIAFRAHVVKLVTGQARGRAMVGNLVNGRDQIRPFAAGEQVAVLLKGSSATAQPLSSAVVGQGGNSVKALGRGWRSQESTPALALVVTVVILLPLLVAWGVWLWIA